MADIQDTSLWREVTKIVGSGPKNVHFDWQVKIHANNAVVLPFKVLSVDFERNYLENYTDVVIVHLKLPLGTFAKRVYPFLNNLDIELTRQPIGEVTDSGSEKMGAQSERYTATMMETENPIIQANVGTISSEEDLNRIDIPDVYFQLTNKSLEQIRTFPTGGVYRNMTGEDVVKSILTKVSRSTSVDDKRKLRGVDMVPASNQKPREQIIIPQGTPLVDIPHHVHWHCGGLYAAGLGYYLQGDYWYLYPCYDTTRFRSGRPTLTIINVPENRMPAIERSYRKDGDNLVVLATGKVSFSDISNLAQLNQGNGVRFADASKMMSGMVQVNDNKALMSRAENNTEVVSEVRPNKINLVTTALRQINANPYIEYSALAARQGSGINLVWENADSSVLYPGMPTKVMYLEGETIKEMEGVLLGAHEYASLRDSGATAVRFTSSVTLSVFVKPLDSSS